MINSVNCIVGNSVAVNITDRNGYWYLLPDAFWRGKAIA